MAASQVQPQLRGDPPPTAAAPCCLRTACWQCRLLKWRHHHSLPTPLQPKAEARPTADQILARHGTPERLARLPQPPPKDVCGRPWAESVSFEVRSLPLQSLHAVLCAAVWLRHVVICWPGLHHLGSLVCVAAAERQGRLR